MTDKNKRDDLTSIEDLGEFEHAENGTAFTDFTLEETPSSHDPDSPPQRTTVFNSTLSASILILIHLHVLQMDDCVTTVATYVTLVIRFATHILGRAV